MHDISISSPLFDSGYQLQLGNVLVDVHEWRKQLKALPALSNATYEKHEEAVNAYKEHFLNDCDYIWAESEREHLKRLWLQHALELSEFYIKEQKFERAIAIEKKLQKLNIEEESHYFTLMKLYDAIGNKSAVEEQYVLLEKMLKEQLAIEPDVEIISWFQQWKNKQYELKN